MSDKLARAKHVRRPETEQAASNTFKKSSKAGSTSNGALARTVEKQTPSVSSSTFLMSACVIISRITGFIRTWTMAYALGATLLSSSYQVANNLPNMLYELVAGGLLVTSFLPVYVSIKNRKGTRASNRYASNLLSIITLFLIVIAAFCIIFPSVVIYTQSFWSNQEEMQYATFFFQFFAIQIIFYGASTIFSGLLNANRDYFWPAIAPVFNNIVVIATFLLYTALAPQDPQAALYVIAIGNPLGVFVQMAILIPSLKKQGIHLRFHINFRDPALKETLSIGIPAIIIMLYSFVITSVQTAASYSFAENGPSIIFYARMWFMLPYSFLVIPISTALFTELATMFEKNDLAGIKKTVVSGINQILFFMIPFMLYLMVFSVPLISLYHAGAFTEESIYEIAAYLSVFALALPFYGINTYLQKVFSSIRKLKVFAIAGIITAAIQTILTALAAILAANGIAPIPIASIAFIEALFFIVCDTILILYLRRYFEGLRILSAAKAAGSGLLFGLLGAGVGAAILFVLETFVAPLDGSIVRSLIYVAGGGIMSLLVTFGLAIKFKVPESAFLLSFISKFTNKFKRK